MLILDMELLNGHIIQGGIPYPQVSLVGFLAFNCKFKVVSSEQLAKDPYMNLSLVYPLLCHLI